MEKWTLAFIWYAHVLHAYNTQFSRAYDTQFTRRPTYDTHLPHNPNPTHCVAYMYMPKSIFAYQYHKFLFFGVLFIHIFMRSGWSVTAREYRIEISFVVTRFWMA